MFDNIKPYSKNVLDAVKGIKKHTDADPFRFKTSAAMLEHICAPNRSTAEKAFKDVFGVGIKEYVIKRRLEASKNFLAEGMTRKQVAAKCLYKSGSAFAAAFKKEFRMTPTQWQMQYAN
jgi:AraC-like DNA-binding protein